MSSYWSHQLPLWYTLHISIHYTKCPDIIIAICQCDISCVSPCTVTIVQLLESPVATVIYPVYLHTPIAQLLESPVGTAIYPVCLHAQQNLSSYWSRQLPLWYILCISIHYTNCPAIRVASWHCDISCVSPCTVPIIQLLGLPVWHILWISMQIQPQELFVRGVKPYTCERLFNTSCISMRSTKCPFIESPIVTVTYSEYLEAQYETSSYGNDHLAQWHMPFISMHSVKCPGNTLSKIKRSWGKTLQLLRNVQHTHFPEVIIFHNTGECCCPFQFYTCYSPISVTLYFEVRTRKIYMLFIWVLYLCICFLDTKDMW